MIRVSVETKTNGQFTPNSASRWVEDLAQAELARWQLAFALDTGGEIRVKIEGEPSVLYASLADVPRPVLRVYWRVDGIDGRLPFWFKKGSLEDAKAAIETHKDRYHSLAITRVTVRPKRAR